MYATLGADRRVTRDLDMTFKMQNNDEKTLALYLKDILKMPSDDCIIFDTDALKIYPTQETLLMTGFNVKVNAYLGNIGGTKIPLAIDISYGDFIHPSTQVATINSLLHPYTINLLSYPFTTVIAEKFSASLQHQGRNTRMKDFYDIYVLTSMFNFNGVILQQAIQGTLNSKGVKKLDITPEMKNLGYLNHQLKESGELWIRYLKELTLTEPVYYEALTRFYNFLYPVWTSIQNNQEFNYTWDCSKLRWQ